MNYYRRYVGDFQRKTMRLDPLDIGIYDLMLDYCYAEEQPLPLEIEDIYAICKVSKPEHRKSVAKVLKLYWEQQTDGYHNKRVDEEIAVSKQARTNGRGGGRPKTGTITGNETGLITGTQTDQQTETQTEPETGTITGSGHPPTTNHQPPTVSLQPPTANHQPPSAIPLTTVSGGASRKRSPMPAKSSGVFDAYADAYRRRYGVDPVRNSKVNGQLCQLVDRLGVDDAACVAGFYVLHNQALYVRGKHPVDLLLRDAEGLRTEWVTGRKVSDADARAADKTQANGEGWSRLIAETRAA